MRTGPSKGGRPEWLVTVDGGRWTVFISRYPTWGGREELLVELPLVSAGNHDRHRLHSIVTKLEQSCDFT